MKRIFKYLFIVIMFVPFIAECSVKVNYEDAIYGANNYVQQFRNYKWYIDYKNGEKYVYDGSNFSSLDVFKYGGLLNKAEYDITTDKTKNYLKIARSYWTLTSSGDKVYTLDNGTYALTDKSLRTAGARVTEYVLHGVKVTGQGSYTDPWMFEKPSFYVNVESVKTEIIRSSDNKDVEDMSVALYGDAIKYTIRLKNTNSNNSVVNVRDTGIMNSLGDLVKVKNSISSVKIGNTTLSSSDAIKAVEALVSKKGYTFTLGSNQVIEIVYGVDVYGNAGDTVTSKIEYSMDEMEAEPYDEVNVSVEKNITYNEISEIGVNVVLALDNSSSMEGTKMLSLRSAVAQFLDIVYEDDEMVGNEVCVVVMPNSKTETAWSTCSKNKVALIQDAYAKLDASGSWTPFTGTFEKARDVITSLKLKNKQNSNFVLFLSDGSPNPNDPSAYLPVAKQLRAVSTFFTIGFETSDNASTKLKNIATTENEPNYPGDLCLWCPPGNDCITYPVNYRKMCYADATSGNIREIFKNIAKKMNEKFKVTTRGVIAISRNLDKTKNITIEVTPKSGSAYTIKKTYQEALDESYVLNKGSRYEINIKKFNSTDKINITYFLERNN